MNTPFSPHSSASQKSSAINILIADDDEHLVEIMRDILDINGYNVITAANGEEAMEMIKNEHPDLLILDLMMPEMDGASVIQELNSKISWKKIPAIIVSGLCKGKSVGARENIKFLDKPVNIAEIS